MSQEPDNLDPNVPAIVTPALIRAKLHDIFPDQATADRVASLVNSTRPANWSRKANAPYFKPFYAEWLKVFVDQMIIKKGDLMFRYSVFCGPNDEKMSRGTLYAQIYQATRYLLEKLDPEGVYAKWYELTHTRKEDVGISIRYIPEYRAATEGKVLPSPDEVQPISEMPLWKRKLDTWLETDDLTPFSQEGLALSPVEIIALKNELNGLQGIQAMVNSYSVKIIRMNGV